MECVSTLTNSMWCRMIEKAETLVAMDVSFAAQHELEQVVWKPCFYKRIEEFRKRFRKVSVCSPTPSEFD